MKKLLFFLGLLFLIPTTVKGYNEAVDPLISWDGSISISEIATDDSYYGNYQRALQYKQQVCANKDYYAIRKGGFGSGYGPNQVSLICWNEDEVQTKPSLKFAYSNNQVLVRLNFFESTENIPIYHFFYSSSFTTQNTKKVTVDLYNGASPIPDVLTPQFLETNANFILSNTYENPWNSYNSVKMGKTIYNVGDSVLNSDFTFSTGSFSKYFDVIHTDEFKNHDKKVTWIYSGKPAGFYVTLIKNSFEVDTVTTSLYFKSLTGNFGYINDKELIPYRSDHADYEYQHIFVEQCQQGDCSNDNYKSFYRYFELDFTHINPAVKEIYVYYDVDTLYSKNITAEGGYQDLDIPDKNPDEKRNWWDYLNPITWFEELGKFLSSWFSLDVEQLKSDYNDLQTKFNEKIPIVSEIIAFFTDLTQYRVPEYSNTYNPFPTITVPQLGIKNAVVMNMTYFNQHRDYIFGWMKAGITILFLLKALKKVRKTID